MKAPSKSERKEMEDKQGNERVNSQSKTKLLAGIIGLLSIIVVAAGVIIFMLLRKPDTEAVKKIGMEAGIVTNESNLANLELNEPFSFTTLYDRDIYITNGKEATCYIGNSEYNYYEDMYIQIYLNDENDDLSEEIYVSKVIPRGSHIEAFTAERELDPGDYRGTLIHSCMNEEGDLVGDTPVIVEIHVTE